MNFLMNGALTVRTRDGATIEMAQEASEEKFLRFALTAEKYWPAVAGKSSSDRTIAEYAAEI